MNIYTITVEVFEYKTFLQLCFHVQTTFTSLKNETNHQNYIPKTVNPLQVQAPVSGFPSQTKSPSLHFLPLAKQKAEGPTSRIPQRARVAHTQRRKESRNPRTHIFSYFRERVTCSPRTSKSSNLRELLKLARGFTRARVLIENPRGRRRASDVSPHVV